MENALHLYNTLTRQKERFEPINPNSVGMYVCGPTVYKNVHIGNVRTFLSFDVVYRYLLHLGYKVRYVRNITDVGHLVNDEDAGEDKIAKQALIEKVEPMEIVQRVTNDFREVMELYNLLPPSIEPTATGHIIEQIEMVEAIIANGLAYEVNGSVYFDVLAYQEKTGQYGELSGRKTDELQSNTRELDGQDEKRNPLDFAIWKKAEKGHIMRWRSPWGEGFPGWHLECSVMSTKYLGETFDIHGGGMDLKFPHHECEIAQNVAATGATPVKYWMHGNMLTVDAQRMAKRVGNVISPRELITGDNPLLDRGYSAMTVRFFMLQTHYAGTLDISVDALQASEKGFRRLMKGMAVLDEITPAAEDTFDADALIAASAAAMNDDFNTPVLIANLFDGVRAFNSAKEGSVSLTAETIARLKEHYRQYVYDVMGLKDDIGQSGNDTVVDGLMEMVIKIRKEARTNKDWSTADLIRDELGRLNIALHDGKDGTTWDVN